MNLEYLKKQWQTALEKFNTPQNLIDEYFTKICNCYNQSGHFYHNLEHIESFLRAIEPYLHKCERNKELILAVFYHDAVYNPLRTDNEEKSAQLARKELKILGIDRETRIRIMYLIRRTANHLHKKHEDDFCTRLFLDGDLYILSVPWEKYKYYAQGVHKEFIRIPDRIFDRKRKDFLKKMLSQKFIYCTPEFREKYEKLARENMLREINELNII